MKTLRLQPRLRQGLAALHRHDRGGLWLVVRPNGTLVGFRIHYGRWARLSAL